MFDSNSFHSYYNPKYHDRYPSKVIYNKYERMPTRAPAKKERNTTVTNK